MGAGFLFTFAAFNTTQTILTTVLESFHGSVSGLTYDLGSVSLVFTYVSTCASLVVVPKFVQRRGPVATLTLAGLCFAFYITSLIFLWEPFVLVASCVVGFGQAAIWVAQGVLLTASSREANRGEDAGLFWGIYSFSGIIGPLVGYFVYQGVNSRGFFLFALACTLIGANIFRGLGAASSYKETQFSLFDGDSEKRPLTGGFGPPVPIPAVGKTQRKVSYDFEAEEVSDEDVDSTEERRRVSFSSQGEEERSHRWWCSLVLTSEDQWTAEKMRILLKLAPLMFFIGFSDGFINASFPLTFARRSDQEAGVFLVFVGWGIAETFGAVLLSRISDRLGRKLLLVIGAFIYSVALVVAFFIVDDGDTVPTLARVSWLAFGAGAAFGLADSLNNTQCFALLGDHFPEPHLSVDAYAVFQILQAFGLAAGFAFSLLSPVIFPDLLVLLISQLTTLIAAVLGVLALPQLW